VRRRAALAASLVALATATAAQSALDDAIRQLMLEGEAAPPPPRTEPRTGAVLRGLDMFSGVVTAFDVPVGGEGQFERMAVSVLACHALEGEADAYAFVEITDTRFADAPGFRGWMIASSPALSALEHPRYDVWLQSCSTEAAEAP
jgi:hypothetical protein